MKQYVLIFLWSFLFISSAFAADGKHLFILSGQSNMEGMHYVEDFNPYVEQAFGKDNVIVVWDAKGGEPISRWYKEWIPAQGDPPEVRGDLYNRLIKKVKKAIHKQEIQTVTFIWMQGETDARNGDGAVYANSLTGLIHQLKLDLKRRDMNIVIGRISDFDLENKEFPDWTLIRNIQVSFAETYPRAAWIDTDDLNDGLSRKGKMINNDLHYSKLGYKSLGRRFAEKAIELIRQFNDE